MTEEQLGKLMRASARATKARMGEYPKQRMPLASNSNNGGKEFSATRITALLEEVGEVSITQAAKALGVAKPSAKDYLRRMHRDGVVVISAYVGNRGKLYPRYSLTGTAEPVEYPADPDEKKKPRRTITLPPAPMGAKDYGIEEVA